MTATSGHGPFARPYLSCEWWRRGNPCGTPPPISTSTLRRRCAWPRWRTASFLIPSGCANSSPVCAPTKSCLFGPAIKAPPVDEFPEIPQVRTPGLTLPEPVVTSLLRAFACASQDSTRAVLRSACLDTSGTGDKAHRIVGTNGRALFSSNSMHLPLKQSVIIPDHPLWKWKPLADSRPWTLRLGKDKQRAEVFRMEGLAWSVTGRLLDGPYPNYRQVIPGPAVHDNGDPERCRPRGGDTTAAPSPRQTARQSSHGSALRKGPLRSARSCRKRRTLDPPSRGPLRDEGADVTVYLDRDYLAKAAAFGLSQVSLIDGMSPVQFSRGGDLMIVMPVRAIAPDRIERPRLVPAVEQFASPPVPVPKPVAPTVPTPLPPKPTGPDKPAKPPKPADPLVEARQQVAEADEALLTARRTPQGRSLTHARPEQRSETKRELGGFRGLLRKLQRGRKNEAKKAS